MRRMEPTKPTYQPDLNTRLRPRRRANNRGSVCRRRTSYLGKTSPHLFTTKQRVDGVETAHCSGCGKRR